GAAAPMGIVLPVPHGPVMAVDLNGNGRSDLVWGEAFGHSTNPYRYALSKVLDDGAGGFGPIEGDTLVNNSPQLGITQARLAAGDLDGDGDLDVVCLVGFFDSWMGWLLNDGVGGLTLSGVTGNLTEAGPLAVRDLDGDGLADLIHHHSDGGDFNVDVYPSLGGGTIGARVRFIGADACGGMPVEDFNGDGALDIAALDGVNGTLVVLRNTTPQGGPTPTAVSLVAARAVEEGIELEWFG